MRFASLSLPSLVTSVAATNLYVSSYAGTITSLQLSQLPQGGYSLVSEAVNNGSEPNPSILTENKDTGVVYCVDEGLTVPNGTISSYQTSLSGELTQIDDHVTVSGPVSAVTYNNGTALAAAHYAGAAVTSWSILPSGGISPLQDFIFTMSAPGPDPSRQDAPHPHEVVLDPTILANAPGTQTGSFIVANDLGADFIRIFSIDPTTSLLTALTPFSVTPGSGPRHGTFLKTTCGKTFYFLVSELGNTVVSYEVTYENNSITFESVFTSGILGDTPLPVGIAAAECLLAPGAEYLLTSARNASLFNLTNFDPTNSTKIPSDTLQSWIIDHETGNLTFNQLSPAGGSFPRQFSVNKNGTLAAVGLQYDSRVVIIERNVTDGTFGDFVAEIDIEGQITSVIWDE